MDSSVLFAVAACLFAIFLIRRLSSKGKLPPGPIGLPILGYIPFLSRKPYLDLQRLAKKYGNVFSIKMGSKYVVVLNDFKSTEETFALNALFGRPPELPFETKETIETEAYIGLPWIEHRKVSLHILGELGFGKSKMEGHIEEEIRELLNHIEGKVDKPFCIYEFLAPSMSNIMSSLIFGKRFKYNDPVVQMFTRLLKEADITAVQEAWHLFFPTVKNISKFLDFGDISKISRIKQQMKEYVIKEIEEHEETLNPSNIRDYIDGYLLEIRNRKGDPSFSKPVLQHMVNAFFGGGSETTRLSVEWLLLTAAHFQDAQRHVQSEIDEVFGQKHFPTWPDRKRMPYTEAFIMELMRWKTIVPLNLLRYALDDAEIDGYFIPKGTWILNNLWAIHHDPEYWGTDAEEFRPERFLTEDGQNVKNWDRYMPFSTGKRACPGEPLAKIEIFLYFTAILQRFNLRTPEGKVVDFEAESAISLMPKPQELVFTKRN